MSLKIFAKTYIINSEHKLLLIRKSSTAPYYPLKWDITGGTVDFGEAPIDAAIREVFEEAGINIIDLHLLNVVSEKFDDVQVITIIYYAFVENPVVKLSYEHDEYQWIDLDKVEELDIRQKYKDNSKLLKEIVKKDT